MILANKVKPDIYHCSSKQRIFSVGVLTNLTRMHSSRMRTGRALTVSRGGGGCLPGRGGGACLPGGGGCLPGRGGCACLEGGGACLEEGGVPACLEGGCLPGGGGCLPGGGVPDQAPPPCGQNHRRL